MKLSAKLKKKLQNISLVAMDVDGVLTAGEIIVLESGEEVKFWNAKDRLLMAHLHQVAPWLVFAWITGRKSSTVESNAKDLGVSYIVQKCHDKRSALQEIMTKEKLQWAHVAYIGDDLIDLTALRAAGFSACPADAVVDVRSRVDYISEINGGRGVARDVLELILRAQGKWEKLITSFLS